MITDIQFLLDGLTAIHVATKDEAVKLADMAVNTFGKRLAWSKRDILSFWDNYENECCYRFRLIKLHDGNEIIDCTYCSVDWYKERQYKIMEFSDIHTIELDIFETGYKDANAALAALF